MVSTPNSQSDALTFPSVGYKWPVSMNLQLFIHPPLVSSFLSSSRWQECTAGSPALFLCWEMWARCLTASSGFISASVWFHYTGRVGKNKADSLLGRPDQSLNEVFSEMQWDVARQNPHTALHYNQQSLLNKLSLWRATASWDSLRKGQGRFEWNLSDVICCRKS